MRILFAGLTSPYPPTNGHRLRTWALVQALAEDGHHVAVVSLAESNEPHGDLGPLERICASVEVVPPPARLTEGGDSLKRLRTLALPIPFGAWKFRSPAFAAALARHVARGVDAIICDGVYNVQNLPVAPGVPVFLNKDDVAHVIMERYLALERSAPRRVYGALEARKVRRWEQWACERVTRVLACSDEDRRILAALAPAARISVVPNVVDTGHYAPRGNPQPRTVLFQGGLDWHPNRDAVEFFATAILPELRRLVPDVVFRVAGRCPDDAFQRRWESTAGVQFTGRVPEMRDEIAKATVCVVPLRIGSGTRLKILEAGAMAKAIVSTPLGAEGLDFVDGEEIRLTDAPVTFARMVSDLLHDESARDAMGRAARRRVESDYSQPVLREALRAALPTREAIALAGGRAPGR